KRDLARAKTWLDSSLAKIPREVGWAEEGRTLYWLGRVGELQGNRAPPARFYGRTAREYPLSFYTLLALSGLRAGFGSELGHVLADLGSAEPAGPEDFVFQPRALFSHEAFARGIELLRLGLGSEARREFQSIGIAAPEERGPIAGGKDREEL